MNQLYERTLRPILTNQIIVDWIAPIVTGLIVLIIPGIITRIIRKRRIKQNVESVNNEILKVIRPFIIEKKEITAKFITNIRTAIIKKHNIKEKFIYNEIELRDAIVLDIARSDFIKENEKIELIENSYKVFSEFDEKEIMIKKLSEEEEDKRALKNERKVFSAIFIVCIIIIVIAYWVKPVSQENVMDNIVITITLLPLFVSTLYLYASYVKIDGVSTLIRNPIEDIYKIIKNIIVRENNNKDKS